MLGGLVQRKIDRREELIDLSVTLQIATFAISLPKFFWPWIPANRFLKSGEVVELNYLRTVCGVREAQTEHLCVWLCLLQSVSRGLVFLFRFDHRQRKVAAVSEEIINALRRAADETFANGDDPSVRNRALLRNRIRLVVPTRCL